uniref:RING-type domain-containing protein n=1 Tax=Meloidogyne hapla TaxID=6305 RepID=A0A1I8BRY2_MELHA
MVYYKFGRCTVCQSRLRPDNIYTLKNCNHTYHHGCITRWISGGSQTCPRCRVHATLTDVKQLFVEEAGGDTSQESGDELEQSTSTTQNLTRNNTVLTLKNKITNRRGIPVREMFFYNTLSHYKIGNNNMVDLVLRQQGGDM